MGTKLTVQQKLYRKTAQRLVLDILRYNTLANQFPNKSDSAVIARFNQLSKSQKMLGDFSFFVEQCRDFSNSAPFENLADSGVWKAEGGTVGISDSVTGEIHGNYDLVASSPYIGLFEESYRFFKLSIEDNTYSYFRSSIVSGISSIEAFIRIQATHYNFIHNQEILVDDQQHKVSFMEKFDQWIPIMKSQKFDKGGKEWNALQLLLKFRDDDVVHPKGVYGFNYDELVGLLNNYKYGIAGILRHLHILFDLYIPSGIIRASCFPEIYVERFSEKL